MANSNDPSPQNDPIPKNEDDSPPNSLEDSPTTGPSRRSGAKSNRGQGVTSMLRDIFRRNAANPNSSEELNDNPPPVAKSGNRFITPIDPHADHDPLLSEVESNNKPFIGEDIGNILFEDETTPDPPPTIQDNRTLPPTSPPSISTPPEKGRLNNLVTGILRTVNPKSSAKASKHDEIINDRLSDIFAKPGEETSETSWEDRFISSINSPASGEGGGENDRPSPFYDPNGVYRPQNESKEKEDGDSIYEEWVGFTKTLDPNTEAPLSKPAELSVSEGTEPIRQLPSPSYLDENEQESQFDEQHQKFKENNPFLYTAQENPSQVSLDEMRQVVLDDIQEESASSPVKKKRISTDKSTKQVRKLSRIEIIAVSIFVGISLLIFIMILLTYFRPIRLAVAPFATTPTLYDPESAPTPIGIQITGGWYFPLSKNTIVDGRWKPKGAEWLQGSDIRRIVALPWNKQLEAAVKTLVSGDEIDITFSNNEHIVYVISKVELLPVDQVNPGGETNPSLLVLLYNADSPDRWLITCLPKIN